MGDRPHSYSSVDSSEIHWEDAAHFLLEESEKSGEEYPAGSDETEGSEEAERLTSVHGLPNGDAVDTGLTYDSFPRQNSKEYHFKTSGTSPNTVARHSLPPHNQSPLSSPGSSERHSPQGQVNGEILRHNSTSPAALNRVSDVGPKTTTGDEAVKSPSITPTHSNFGQHQLISPSMGIAFHPPHTLEIQNDSIKSSRKSPLTKQASMGKKKRSGSWYNTLKSTPKISHLKGHMDKVLSSSYKQKNDDFHKFFKDLPATERLLVDYTCALMKDILIQGRLYVSQNYLGFHSNILKWQTALTVKLVNIDNMSKERTVKLFPNAIQFVMNDKSKITFTSFTARDRAYLTTFRLWQNALLEKPMTPNELWGQIHSNYGDDLGLCSSDDDYVRPPHVPKKHRSLDSADLESGEKYEFGTTNKIKKKKKSKGSTPSTPIDGDGIIIEKKKSKSSSSTNRLSSHDSSNGLQMGTDNSTADDKSMHSSQYTQEDNSEDDDVLEEEDNANGSKSGSKEDEVDGIQTLDDAEDDEPSEFLLPDCHKISLSCEYNTSASDMFRIIFGDDCPFWKETLVNKHSTEIDFGTWCDDEKVKGQKIRNLSYTLRLDNPIGPKTSHCKEIQILYPTTVVGKTYAVDCIVQNHGIPYADYFQTCMRYCIRKVSRDACHVRITSELRYKKTPWGLIKNFIEKNVASGLTDNFRKLEVQLQERIDFEKQQTTLSPNNGQTKNNLRRRSRKSESVAMAGGERTAQQDQEVLQRKALSDLNNNQQRNASSGTAMHIPNGVIPTIHENPKKQHFISGNRLFSGVIFSIFLLLVYSNYTMYFRLTTLEQVTHAAATADGVDPSVTAALLDRPGVPIHSSPEILSAYLQAIDKRLRKLEGSMIKFSETYEKKWMKMEKDMTLLQEMMRKVLKQKIQRD